MSGRRQGQQTKKAKGNAGASNTPRPALSDEDYTEDAGLSKQEIRNIMGSNEFQAMLNKTVADSLNAQLTKSLNEVLPNILPQIIGNSVATEIGKQFSPIENNLKNTVEAANGPLRQSLSHVGTRSCTKIELNKCDKKYSKMGIRFIR